jgi:hypothetical protein
MTHKQVFIASHLGAGADMLVDMISANRRIGKINRDNTQVYTDPIALDYAQRKTLEINSDARMFVDRLVYNYEFAHKSFYDNCYFVFLVREPEESLKTLLEMGYNAKTASRYYNYRLRRLCEMSRKAKNKILVTWDELISKNAFTLIKNFVGMKELNLIYRPYKIEKTIDQDTVFSCRQCYDRYLNYLKIVTRENQRSNCENPCLS